MKRATCNLCLLFTCLGLMTSGLWLIGCGGSPPASASGCNSMGGSYCMTFVSQGVTATPILLPGGLGLAYGGKMTFSFSPALPSSLGLVDLVFNGKSITGTAKATGMAQLSFDMGGTSLTREMTNPTTVYAVQQAATTALATDTFNWMSSC